MRESEKERAQRACSMRLLFFFFFCSSSTSSSDFSTHAYSTPYRLLTIMGTTVDSLYMSPSIRGTAWSESGGRPAEAAAAESSTAAAAMMGPFEGAGGAVAGAALPPSSGGMDDGGVPEADMLPDAGGAGGVERKPRLFCLFFLRRFFFLF